MEKTQKAAGQVEDHKSGFVQKARKIVGTPYDDAFRTMTIDCSSMLIPVLNKIFGKNYTGEEEIIFYPNEHFANETDGTYEKKVTDSMFSLLPFFGIRKDRYVFECQSSDDNSMIVRIVEYQVQSALDDSVVEKEKITLGNL